MSALDMAVELERIGRLRRLLEPLAVIYYRAILQANKEPFEVRLTVRQSTDNLGDNCPAVGMVHIIDGESLQAVHEVWQEYHRSETELLEQIGTANE